MSIVLPSRASSSTTLEPAISKVATSVLVVAASALGAMLILFLRFFVFEYFHGDPAPLQAFVRFVSGS